MMQLILCVPSAFFGLLLLTLLANPVYSMSYQIILREGITGGFKGPGFTEVVQIMGDNTGATIFQAKPSTTGSANDFAEKQNAMSVEQLSPLLDYLKSKTQDLPAGGPSSKDYYGQGTSIQIQVGDFQWANAIQEACGQEESAAEATPEQKTMFNELVNSIKSLAKNHILD